MGKTAHRSHEQKGQQRMNALQLGGFDLPPLKYSKFHHGRYISICTAQSKRWAVEALLIRSACSMLPSTFFFHLTCLGWHFFFPFQPLIIFSPAKKIWATVTKKVERG